MTPSQTRKRLDDSDMLLLGVFETALQAVPYSQSLRLPVTLTGCRFIHIPA